ncbi:MAG: hypothetical protein WCJ30_19225 [Deltaproteobacteria bacterium]
MHPGPTFLDTLEPLGFAGEHAWGTDHFCGGGPRIGCSAEVSDMESVWR